ERDIQLFEQAPDPRDAPVHGVLAKRLVHEIEAAARKIRTQHSALGEDELFDEQGVASCDLSAAKPIRILELGARECGHPVGALLREHRWGVMNSEQRRCCAAEQSDERASPHCPSKAPDTGNADPSISPLSLTPDFRSAKLPSTSNKSKYSATILRAATPRGRRFKATCTAISANVSQERGRVDHLVDSRSRSL